MKSKLMPLIIGMILIIAGGFAAAYSAQFLYPEDLSWKSGLVTEKIIQDANGKDFQRETSYWSSRYLFDDPSTGSYDKFERIPDPYGFKAKLVKTWGDSAHAAKYSQNLVSVPYLEGTEVLKYSDSDTDTKTYADRSEFDSYGNVKISYNLGYTGLSYGSSLQKSYDSPHDVKDPRNQNFDSIISFDPENSDLMGHLSGYEDSNKAGSDTTRTYTTYAYETETRNWAYSPEMYGWTGLPVRTRSYDYLGRSLGESYTDYVRGVSELQFCSASYHGPSFMCSDDSGDCPKLAPSFSAIVPGEMNYPDSAISTGDLLILNDQITRTSFKYDDCGNVLQTNVEAKYEQYPAPKDNTDEARYGSEVYRKMAAISYDGERIKPVEVTVKDPKASSLNITTQAQYYAGLSGDGVALRRSINERQVGVEVDYDDLGRIIKVIGPYDSSDSPTATYEYIQEGSRNKILEKIKREGNVYSETYYFYDGMGRMVQTQSRNDDGTYITSGTLIDGNGKVLREYRPISSSDGLFGTFNEPYYSHGLDTTWIEYTYDPLGRAKTIKDVADDSVVTKTYGIDNSFDVLNEQDPNGNIHTYWNDARGDLVGIGLPSP